MQQFFSDNITAANRSARMMAITEISGITEITEITETSRISGIKGIWEVFVATARVMSRQSKSSFMIAVPRYS
jgi:hypothetical protein